MPVHFPMPSRLLTPKRIQHVDGDRLPERTNQERWEAAVIRAWTEMVPSIGVEFWSSSN